MAVSVLKRPTGFILTNDITGGYIQNSGGHATYGFSSGHNLSTGDYVYIKSKVKEYNGFWYAQVIDGINFKIREYATAALVAWIKDLIVTADRPASVFEATTHTWNCVHLPVVYKLSNDRWPINSVDTARTISSVTDSNGYCSIVSSGNMTAAVGNIAALEYVIISNATDSTLNGVWQVTTAMSDTTFILEIPYSAANDTALTGATIQYYYNNFNVKVQIFGGLNSGHVYYAQEPYALLATIDVIPDEYGICTFSISEYLKQNVAIENNLLQGTLPNNLDAFTMFFIKYAEVYDDSDGITLTQITPTYTNDTANFEGYAINAKLPFKNVYSGAMSEYASGDANQKFLTAFVRPTIFSGKYFDLSWINTVDTAGYIITLRQKYYLNDVLVTTVDVDQEQFDAGVYRLELDDPDCDLYDRVDITVERRTSTALPAPSTWTDGSSSYDTKGATDFQETVTAADGVVSAFTALSMAAGETIYITYTVVVTLGGGEGLIVQPVLADGAGVTVPVTVLSDSADLTFTGPGAFNRTTTYIAVASATVSRLYMRLTNAGTTSGAILTITMPSTLQVLSATSFSETKTVDINCDCLQTKATGYYLGWLNYLGGFDWWYFTAYTEKIIDITDSGETEENIFPEWPNSYGEFADTIRKQTFRESREQILIRSQHITEAQLNAIKNIKTSPLVQIVNSIYDRRTVLVDTDSFTWLKEGNNLFEISFIITYTDDVPSQTV